MRPLRHISSVGLAGNFSVAGLQPLRPPNAGNPLDLIRLTPLMQLASGRVETTIALIDGPVATNHKDLSSANVREIPGRLRGTCELANSFACMHGTFVAGILCAQKAQRTGHLP